MKYLIRQIPETEHNFTELSTGEWKEIEITKDLFEEIISVINIMLTVEAVNTVIYTYSVSSPEKFNKLQYLKLRLKELL